jgi:hypothetical protein
MEHGFGLADLKMPGAENTLYDKASRRGFEYSVPEWIGRMIRDLAGKLYRRFDIYGS